MNKFASILLLLFAITLANAQTNVSGTISQNTIWSLGGSPYIVTGNVYVSSGVILTVDSGVVVRFQSNQSLIVYGTLNARHTLFTSDKDTVGGNPQKGDWYSIQVGDYYTSGTAALDTCRIRYGGSPYAGYGYGNVFVYTGSATITGCDISNSKNHGIMFAGSYLPADLTLINTNIFSNDWPITYLGAGSLVFNGTNNLTGNTHNGIQMLFSSNSNYLKLDTAAVPYFFPYYYTVNSGGTLEIASSDMLKFGGSVYLWIDGTLIANAAPGERIFFTAYTDDNVGGDTNGDGTATVPTSRYWGAVQFRNTSVDSACIMKRCKVTFGGYYTVGGITISDASPTIDSCEMANNYYGAMIQGVSNPVFSNNTIGSSDVVPIAMSFDANPLFTNNFFSFSDNRYDAIGLLGGTLSADAVLPIRSVTATPGAISNITYLMLDNVTVPAGKTLTINKGVVIKAAYDYPYLYYQPRITVQGKLVANATPDSVIVITSSKDDNFGNPGDTNKDGTQSTPVVGDWGGIVFEATSDSNSILNYCRIKYGSLPGTYYETKYISGGEITTVRANPTISNCEIKDVQYGVYAFETSNPKIWNNAFINTQYTPIAMSVSAEPSFVGNTFTNTQWTALGIIGENLGANGTIKQRTVAGISNITYVLLENLIINSGAYVTVDPGVVMKFYYSGIFVNGGFRAAGTVSGGSIVFTSLKDDNFGNPFDTNGDGAGTSPAPNDWSSIIFGATSDDAFCLLDSSLIKFGGYYFYYPYYGYPGSVTFTDASGTISHSTISDSYTSGLRCEGASNPQINGVDIRNCRLDPIAMSLKSNPTFTSITLTANGTNGIRIIEGTLSSDATLAKRDVAGINNIAYIVDNLTISPNAVLTIEPGVVIKLSYYNNGIVVQGALVAKGTPTQKIIFTSLRDDSKGGDTNNDGNNSSPNKGDWYSLEFDNSGLDSLNVLKNCEIRYNGSGYYYYYGDFKYYGALRIFDAAVMVDSCVIEQSSTSGIGIYGSANPTIQNCLINNISSTPIMMSMFSNPTFANNAAFNVGYMALGIVPETYSVNATVPKRDFAGYTNITYMLFSGYYYNIHTINSGTTITIPAGIVFKDLGYYGYYDQIVVNGALIVNGTDSEKVVFTDARDDSYGNPRDTNGDGSATQPTIQSYALLHFNDVSDDSLSSIRHAVFRYASPGIILSQASPKISNCLFDKVDVGIRLDGVSTPVVDSCTFNNLTYTPLKMSLVSYPRSTVGNVISGTTYRALGILEETLVQDVTLPKRTFAGINNIPYVFSNYTVGTGAILTIEPGVILKFFSNTGLVVRKGLIAEGGAHPDSTIVFTSLLDDFYGGDSNADSSATAPDITYYYYSNWYGISFEDESLDPLCRIRNAVIRYAGLYYTDQIAGIVTHNASPTITYTTISKNRYGIVATGASNPVVNYCDIYQNQQQGIRNVNQSFNIDARWNWWGSNTGPTHSGNPGGTGDVVADSVNYNPFLATGAQVPVAGDVSLNGRVQAYDASVILKFVVDTVANPLNDIQKLVADVSGAMGITSYDASLILQYVVGNIQYFPIEFNRTTKPAFFPKQVLASSIEIGSASASRGSTVTIPVRMSEVQNLFSADIIITFNGEMLTPKEAKLAPTLSNMTMASSFSPGQITIAMAGANKVDANGDVLFITFEVAKDVRGTVKSPIGFSRLLLNEQDFTSSAKSGEVTITGKPTEFALLQNYPNPFNPTTTIRYQIPDDGVHVKVAIYSLVGELVKTLVDEEKNAGVYDAVWDGRSDAGQQVGSGIYFYRISAVGIQTFTNVKKMLLVK